MKMESLSIGFSQSHEASVSCFMVENSQQESDSHDCQLFDQLHALRMTVNSARNEALNTHEPGSSVVTIENNNNKTTETSVPVLSAAVNGGGKDDKGSKNSGTNEDHTQGRSTRVHSNNQTSSSHGGGTGGGSGDGRDGNSNERQDRDGPCDRESESDDEDEEKRKEEDGGSLSGSHPPSVIMTVATPPMTGPVPSTSRQDNLLRVPSIVESGVESSDVDGGAAVLATDTSDMDAVVHLRNQHYGGYGPAVSETQSESDGAGSHVPVATVTSCHSEGQGHGVLPVSLPQGLGNFQSPGGSTCSSGAQRVPCSSKANPENTTTDTDITHSSLTEFSSDDIPNAIGTPRKSKKLAPRKLALLSQEPSSDSAAEAAVRKPAKRITDVYLDVSVENERTNVEDNQKEAMHVIPLSQNDLFEEEENDDMDAGDGPVVCTPAEHLQSLQLSGQAMLVPDTEDDMQSVEYISPSPEAYGPTPIIIPSSPTAMDSSETDGQNEVTVIQVHRETSSDQSKPDVSSHLKTDASSNSSTGTLVSERGGRKRSQREKSVDSEKSGASGNPDGDINAEDNPSDPHPYQWPQCTFEETLVSSANGRSSTSSRVLARQREVEALSQKGVNSQDKNPGRLDGASQKNYEGQEKEDVAWGLHYSPSQAGSTQFTDIRMKDNLESQKPTSQDNNNSQNSRKFQLDLPEPSQNQESLCTERDPSLSVLAADSDALHVDSIRSQDTEGSIPVFRLERPRISVDDVDPASEPQTSVFLRLRDAKSKKTMTTKSSQESSGSFDDPYAFRDTQEEVEQNVLSAFTKCHTKVTSGGEKEEVTSTSDDVCPSTSLCIFSANSQRTQNADPEEEDADMAVSSLKDKTQESQVPRRSLDESMTQEYDYTEHVTSASPGDQPHDGEKGLSDSRSASRSQAGLSTDLSLSGWRPGVMSQTSQQSRGYFPDQSSQSSGVTKPHPAHVLVLKGNEVKSNVPLSSNENKETHSVLKTGHAHIDSNNTGVSRTSPLPGDVNIITDDRRGTAGRVQGDAPTAESRNLHSKSKKDRRSLKEMLMEKGLKKRKHRGDGTGESSSLEEDRGQDQGKTPRRRHPQRQSSKSSGDKGKNPENGSGGGGGTGEGGDSGRGTGAVGHDSGDQKKYCMLTRTLTNESVIILRLADVHEVFSKSNVKQGAPHTSYLTEEEYQQYISQQKKGQSTLSPETSSSSHHGSSLASGDLADISSISKSSSGNTPSLSKSDHLISPKLHSSSGSDQLSKASPGPTSQDVTMVTSGAPTPSLSPVKEPVFTSTQISPSQRGHLPGQSWSDGSHEKPASTFRRTSTLVQDKPDVSIEMEQRSEMETDVLVNPAATSDILDKPAVSSDKATSSSSLAPSASLFPSPELKKTSSTDKTGSSEKSVKSFPSSASLFTSPELKKTTSSEKPSTSSKSGSSAGTSASLFTSSSVGAEKSPDEGLFQKPGDAVKPRRRSKPVTSEGQSKRSDLEMIITQTDEPTDVGQREEERPKSAFAPVAKKHQTTAKSVSSRQSEAEKVEEPERSSSPEIPMQIDPEVLSASANNKTRTPSSKTSEHVGQHHPTTLPPGTAVMAKWKAKDLFYYPGHVVSLQKNSKYLVAFEDGTKSQVKENEVIAREMLSVGQSVMVESDDEFYDAGIVKQCEKTQNKVIYTVELDSGKSRKYPRSKVILSSDQAANLIEEITEAGLPLSPGPSTSQIRSTPSKVSLDNIVDGKRRRTPVQKDVPMAAKRMKVEADAGGEQVKKPVTKSLTRRGNKRPHTEVEPKATSTPTSKGKSPLKKTLKEAKSSSVTKTSSPARKPPVAQAPSVSAAESVRTELFTSEEARPTSSSLIFDGCVFILTYHDRSTEEKKRDKKLMRPGGAEVSTTEESSLEEEESLPFDKNKLQDLIESEGGVVMHKFDKNQVAAARHCFLISDIYQRTVKYFHALAAAIPCVSHIWIRDCCKQGKLLDWNSYILPAGICIETNKIIEWNSRGSDLAGMHVMVSSTDRLFTEMWTSVLDTARCELVSRIPASKSDDSPLPEVLISDGHLPANILRRVRQLQIPLVTSEWIIQSLINGQRMFFDTHPKYMVDIQTKKKT